MMMINILDASALVAFIKKEKGYEKIEKLFLSAESRKESVFMHHVNFIEFLYKIRQIFTRNKCNEIISDLQTPFFGVMNYSDSEIGFYTGYLKSEYRLSLADAIGLAYAKNMDGRFWTADRLLLPVAEKEDIAVNLFR
jgi:predicted nucleic acid-binding protein